jgi:hypothetical protein
MRHRLSISDCSPVMPQAPGHGAGWRASSTTLRQRGPGAEDPPPEASEAPAREAEK